MENGMYTRSLSVSRHWKCVRLYVGISVSFFGDADVIPYPVAFGPSGVNDRFFEYIYAFIQTTVHTEGFKSMDDVPRGWIHITKEI